MKLQLRDDISSPQDLKATLLEIKRYRSWATHRSVKKRLNPENEPDAPAISPSAVGLINEWVGDQHLTMDGLEKLITALEDFLETAPYMTITLAAPPSNGLKKQLVSWCRANIEPNVLVAFSFNSTLLGGLVVRYGSHIFDWSFRRQILDARAQFPEVLRRV